MVYVREHSHTRGMLSQFMCLDVVILIEDYLIPRMPKSGDARAIRRVKLECGFSEYIEMEFGPRDVIEKMFLDACSADAFDSKIDIFALLAAGARNLKSGLTASIRYYHGTFVSNILISLNAIGTASEYVDRRRTVHEFDVIDYITDHPEIGHLLSMIGPIGHVEYILGPLQKCVKNESIEMIEILISKLHEDMRQTALTDVLVFAVEYRSRRIIEYAIDSGANARYLLPVVIRDIPSLEQWVIDMLEKAAYSAKRRRFELSSSDQSQQPTDDD